MSIPDHLQGLWTAYLVDEDGFAYRSTQAAERDDDSRWFQVAILRRSALPVRAGAGRRIPADIVTGDLIWIAEEELPLHSEDVYERAGTHLERAQAMAAGLNAAGGTS